LSTFLINGVNNNATLLRIIKNVKFSELLGKKNIDYFVLKFYFT